MPIKLPYRVVHASGQDDAHRVSELNYHSPLTKGWQSSRYCLYPQDIVIQLDNRSRLRKVQVLSHQFLIATKVEFFVGDVPDGVTVTLDNARYTRLGYVSLSDNEKTGFKARELKSVQVDAVGVFLKLNIHKNHINKFNLYNQVGIIAVNVIGEPVRSPMDHLNDMNFYDDGKKKRAIEDDPSLEGLFNRPDYISPLDDLAFDMYQDPEVAQLIRRLEKKKQEAVLQERYDYAKKLKHTIQELQKVGEKLGKYEVEKRQAIEDEDYDKAKLKKVQMDEYRLQVYKDLNVNGLLETTGSRHPQPVFLESVRQPTPPRLMELSETPSPPRSSPLPRTPYDDRPLPAIRNPLISPSTPPPVIPHEKRSLPIHTPQKTPSSPPPVIPHEKRSLPIHTPQKTPSLPPPVIPHEERPLPIHTPQKTPSLPPPVIPHEERPLPIHTPQKTPSLPPPVIPHEKRSLPIHTPQKTPSLPPPVIPHEERPLPIHTPQKTPSLPPPVIPHEERPLPIHTPQKTPSLPPPVIPHEERPLPIHTPQKTPSLPPPVIPHEKRSLPIHTPQKTPSSPPPVIPHEERPLPIHTKDLAQPATPPPQTPYDERVIPTYRNKPTVTEEPVDQPLEESNAGITGEPEPMSEKEMRDASSAIDVFGEPLVSKAYSKTWSYREDALLAVYKQMQELSTSTSKDDAKNMMRASIFLIKRAIEDKVYAVFKAALNLLKMILTEYNHKHKIPRQDTTFVVERTLPSLFHKSGDTAQRNRDDAKSFIVEMANFPEVKPTHVVPHECVKPFKLTMGQRLAQSRCEIVEMLYKEFKLTSGLTLDSVMHFNTNALEHNNNQVREVAERMIKQLYKDEGPEIKEYLPADDEKTRKITLWRQLFEHFDKVDGKPSKTVIKKQKAEEEAKKQAEIETLQKQLKTLKDMASGKQPIDESIVNEQPKKSTRKADNKPKLKQLQPKQPPAKGEEDEASVYNIDNICIFCGERNESFTEEGLDLHYWKNCPMLKRCANCKQVVEIASYTEHLLSECESKATYSRCSRCTEAIPKSEYDQHVADKACNAAKPSMNHCPLCHQNISAGEDGWKDHLMGKDGCKQNPRRLLALNKQPPQGGKTTTTTANRGKTKPLAKKKAK